MQPNPSTGNSKKNRPWNLTILLLFCGCGLVLLVSLLFKAKPSDQASQSSGNGSDTLSVVGQRNHPALVRAAKHHKKLTAEEQVAERLTPFGQNRRVLTHRYAEKLGIGVPSDVEEFFAAAERGNWEEIDRLFQELKKKRYDPNYPDQRALQQLWSTVVETFGAHESAHLWPAQALLDYGRDTLGSLQPDMVYIGGTDPGRFIPTFLNETSGDHHIVLTQNALADGDYLRYLTFLYGDRMQTVSDQERDDLYKGYCADAEKRDAHDRDFPDEPKQMKPNEFYKKGKGDASATGIDAVMAMNELLLKKLQEKNPEMSFAMEESFSMPSTYTGAVPLGPIMQLGSESAPTPLTPAQAAGSLDYWRDRVNQFTTAPGYDPTHDPERAYAHMIVAQGNLFSSQNFSAEAEQAYRLAQQLASNELEPVSKIYELLNRTGRASEASGILAHYQQAHPEKAEAIRAVRERR